jgi:hypothetical protein
MINTLIQSRTFVVSALFLFFLGSLCLLSAHQASTRASGQALINVKLSGEMQPNGDVRPFFYEISPDSRYIVYAAHAYADGHPRPDPLSDGDGDGHARQPGSGDLFAGGERQGISNRASERSDEKRES